MGDFAMKTRRAKAFFQRVPSRKYGIAPRLLGLLAACLVAGALSGCQNPLKKPYAPDEDIAGYMQMLESYVKAEKWPEALEAQHKIKLAWHKIHRRVSLNADEGDIDLINEHINVLRAYLEEKEKTEALATLYRLRSAWESIGKL
ncbi:hypothetical protein BSNK01_05880 [Bacillaceae bacterium]